MAASWIVLPRTYWSRRMSSSAGRASPSSAYSAATCSGESGTPVAGSEMANGPSTRSMPSMASISAEYSVIAVIVATSVGEPSTSARMTIGVVSPGANSVWRAT